MKNRDNVKSKKKIILTSLILSVVVICSFMLGYFIQYWCMDPTIKELYQVFDIANQHYYGKVDSTEEDFANALIREALDEYSAYYNPNSYSEVKNNASGQYSGVGVSFSNGDNTTIVFSVSGNSPADKAGLMAGDILRGGIDKNGEEWTFSNRQDVKDFFSSMEVNEPFTLHVERTGEVSLLSFTLKKEQYVKTYVEYLDSENQMKFLSSEAGAKPEKTIIPTATSEITDSNVAHIKILSFEGDMVSQLKEALQFMKESGRSKLLLDLRNNGGGYMSVLSDVSALLVKDENSKNPIITYVKEKGERYRHYSSASTNFPAHVTEISVLANDRTASASEALIGAMLHYGTLTRENLIIEKNSEGVAKTYGKGIMQTTYKLASGGAFKLTTAKLYWPDMQTCIHGEGIIVTGENAVISSQTISRGLEVLAD